MPAVVTVKRKEAMYLKLNLALSSGDDIAWDSGTYTVYAAKSRKALSNPYSEYDENYLYQVLNSELIEASPDIAYGVLRVPLTVDRLDYTDSYVLLIKAAFGEYAVYKQVVDVNITLNDAN